MKGKAATPSRGQSQIQRRSGSVRFDPYYKLQRWDPRAVAWRDIQRRYPTAATAAATAPVDGERYRVMQITMAGRGPIVVSDGRGRWTPC